jgi:hypothetical protein
MKFRVGLFQVRDCQSQMPGMTGTDQAWPGVLETAPPENLACLEPERLQVARSAVAARWSNSAQIYT